MHIFSLYIMIQTYPHSRKICFASLQFNAVFEELVFNLVIVKQHSSQIHSSIPWKNQINTGIKSSRRPSEDDMLMGMSHHTSDKKYFKSCKHPCQPSQRDKEAKPN